MSAYRERQRITFQPRPVTARVSPRDVARYLRGEGWTEVPSGRWFLSPHTGQRVPSPRRDDRALSDVIEAIARRERRSPAETLRDIDDGRWRREATTRRMTAMAWPAE